METDKEKLLKDNNYKKLRSELLKRNCKILKYLPNGIIINFKSFSFYEMEQIQKELNYLIHFEF